MEITLRTLRKMAYGLLLLDIVLLMMVAVSLSLLRLQGGQLLTVQSSSMEPVLKVGDAVITSSFVGQSLQLGKIISYHNPSDPSVIISHRIVEIDSKTGRITTAGDRLKSKDEPIMRSNIQGRVTYVLPRLGWILNMLRKPWCLIIVIYLPACALMCNELIKVIKQLNNPRYKLLARR